MSERRIVYRVTYDRTLQRWVLASTAGHFEHFRFKAYCVAVGAQRCREIKKGGGLAQLVVHGKNGRIQFEWTYGEDPERSKG